MRIVQVTTARWDGVLLVAVLPAYDEIVAGEAPEKRRRKAVMEILDRLDVRVIDGTSSFHAAPDPAGLFALRIANHPNAAGHALLARQIIVELRRIPQMALLISEDQ
jgi:hypothetical protein